MQPLPSSGFVYKATTSLEIQQLTFQVIECTVVQPIRSALMSIVPTDIQKLHVAHYRRPADTTGSAYWLRTTAAAAAAAGQAAGGVLLSASHSFGTSAECKANFTGQISDFNAAQDALRLYGATRLSDPGYRQRPGPGLERAKHHPDGRERRTQFRLDCSGLGLSKNIINRRHNADGTDDESRGKLSSPALVPIPHSSVNPQ